MAAIAVDTADAVYMVTVVINKAVTVTMGVRKTFHPFYQGIFVIKHIFLWYIMYYSSVLFSFILHLLSF